MLQAGCVRALGTMSGTSLDGVDAAVVETDGAAIHRFGPTAYRAYLPGERDLLAASLGKWPGDDLAEAEALVERAHLEVLRGFEAAAIVGFHGQTLAHDPQGRGTHQLGSGTRLAQALDLPVAWNFRSADIEAGGEGAPLAPFFHFACAKWIRADAPLAFLNLGGVGNLTWVDPRCARPEEPGALLAFDTGPANAPIDDAVMARRGIPCDRDGALAAQGAVAQDLVAAALGDLWFRRAPPKSLDRDAFATLIDRVAPLGDADAVATLTAIAAASVAAGVAQCPAPPARVLVGGGGRHNTAMMAMLAGRLACPVDPVEAVGLDGDMLEAQAFAHLAVRVARGLPTSCPGTTGARAPVSGGTVSRPLGQPLGQTTRPNSGGRMKYETDLGAGQGRRLGLMVLSTDETLEWEVRGTLARHDLNLLHARIPARADVTPDDLRAMAPEMTRTADLLPKGLSAVGYGCTSASALIGAGEVTRHIQAAHPGTPVTNPLSAVIAALRALGTSRVAMVSPYLRQVNAPLCDALAAAGITVVNSVSFEQHEDWTVARISERSTHRAMIEVGQGGGVEAIFTSCTNLRTFNVIEPVEEALGVPVVSSNQALLWDMMRCANMDARGWGPGRLFELKTGEIATE